MGKMKDALISGSTDEEMNNIIDNARELNTTGYVEFLENQLEMKDKALKRLKKILDDHNKKESL